MPHTPKRSCLAGIGGMKCLTVLVLLLLSLSAATGAESKRIEVEVFCPTQNEEAWASYNTARSLEEQGKLDRAIIMYKKAIELDPGYCDAMDNLGYIYRQVGDIQTAMHWYRESLKVFPENIVAHINLAVAYRLLGENESAVPEYEAVIKARPDNAEGYYGLGSTYLEMGKTEQAVRYFKKAEELYIKESSPHLPDAQYFLGASYLLLSKQEEAIKYFELLYPKMKNNPALNFSLGFAYMTKDDPDIDKARKYIGRAQELGMEVPAEILDELSAE